MWQFSRYRYRSLAHKASMIISTQRSKDGCDSRIQSHLGGCYIVSSLVLPDSFTSAFTARRRTSHSPVGGVREIKLLWRPPCHAERTKSTYGGDQTVAGVTHGGVFRAVIWRCVNVGIVRSGNSHDKRRGRSSQAGAGHVSR